MDGTDDVVDERDVVDDTAMVEAGLEGASAVDELPELVPSLQAVTPMSTVTSPALHRIDVVSILLVAFLPNAKLHRLVPTQHSLIGWRRSPGARSVIAHPHPREIRQYALPVALSGGITTNVLMPRSVFVTAIESLRELIEAKGVYLS